MAETTVKMTNKDWYELIKGIVAESEAEQKAEMIDFKDGICYYSDVQGNVDKLEL